MKQGEAIVEPGNLKEGETKELLQALYYEKKKTKMLEKQLLALQVDRSNLRDEISQLQVKTQKMTEGARETEQLNQQLTKLQEHYQIVKNEYDLALARSGSAEEEAMALRHQQSVLKKLLHTTKSEKEKAEQRLKSYQEQVGHHSKRLEELESKAVRLSEVEAELLRKSQQLETNNKLVAAIKQREEKQNKELQELKIALTDNEKRLRDFEHVDKQSLEESRQHGQQLERVIQFLRERGEETQLEKRHLEEEFQKSQETIASLKKELLNAKQEWKDLSEHISSDQQSRRAVDEECEAIKTQFSDLKNQISGLKKTLQDKEKQLEGTLEAITELQREKQEFKASNKDLEAKVYHLEIGKDEALKRCAILEQELENLSQSTLSGKTHLGSLKAENEELMVELKTAKHQYNTVKNCYEALDQEIKDLESKEEKQRKTIQDLKASLAARESAHHTETIGLKEEIHTLKEQLLSLQNFESENEKLTVQLQEIKRVGERRKEEYDRKMGEVAGLQKSVDEHVQKAAAYELAQTEHLQAIGRLKSELEEAQLNSRGWKEENERTQHVLKQLESQKEVVQKNLDLKTQAVEELKAKLEAVSLQKEDYRLKVEELLQSNEQSNLKNKQVHEQLEKALQQLGETEHKVKKTMEEQEGRLSEFNQLSEQHAKMQRNLQQLSQEYEDVKHKLEAAVEDKQQLQKQFHEVKHIHDEGQAQRHELVEKLGQLQQELGDKLSQLEKVTSHADQLESKFEELQILVKRKETSLEELERAKSSIEKEKQASENEALQLKRKIEEVNSRAQMAQQHLAKKVKETTLLSEDLERKNHQLQESRNSLAASHNQLSELRNAFENQTQEKRKLEDKLQDTVRTMDEKLQRWEAKYEDLYKRWQQSEASNKELSKQKEKLDQLQSFLSNLSGGPSSYPSNPSPPPSGPDREQKPVEEPLSHVDLEPLPPVKEEVEKVPSHTFEELALPLPAKEGEHPPKKVEKSDSYQNLFDMTKLQQKQKYNLFDD